MSNSDQIAGLRGQGLLPFQANFVLEFLQPDSNPVWELASPSRYAKRPGTGAFSMSAAMDTGLLKADWWSRGESNP